MAESTHYEILDVAPTATSAEVKAAYRKLSTKVHPDQGGPAALFIQVKEAYETLSDPSRRAAYDAVLAGVGPSNEAAPAGDSGWVRVEDEAPAADTEAPEQPPSGANATGGDPSWASPPPGPEPSTGTPPPSTGYRPPPAATAPGYTPPPTGPIAAGNRHAPSYFSRHPSGAVAIAGLVVLWLGVGFHSGIAILGLIALIFGGIGLIGTRKAQMADNLRRSGMANIDAMSGTDFEIYLEQLFGSRGYSVWRSGGRGDFGADLVLDGPGGRTVVQAKRWSAVVGHASVQEVVAARGHYQGNHAIVVTNAHFSAHAQKLAQSNYVELWDRERVAYEITQAAAIPPTPAPQRFGAELAAGAPVVFGSLLALVASLSGAKRSKRTRRRR